MLTTPWFSYRETLNLKLETVFGLKGHAVTILQRPQLPSREGLGTVFGFHCSESNGH